MNYKEAVNNTEELSNAYQPGIHALSRTDRNRIVVKDSYRLAGSVNLETSVRRAYPEKPIWDYGIGWRTSRRNERAIWIEVHSADSGHVNDIIKKVRWLKDWLYQKAPMLKEITHENGYVWIASGGIALSKTSQQARQLANEGVSYPRKLLELPGIW